MKQTLLLLFFCVQSAIGQATFHGNIARKGVYDSPGPKQLNGGKWWALKSDGNQEIRCGASDLPVIVDGDYKDIDRFVEDAAPLGFAGQVLIAVDGRVVLHKAYGFADRAARKPVTTTTAFGIASISKMFTAVAVLKAQEEGELSVDDSISKYLPGVPSELASITIAQLLAHTSGIGRGFTNDFEDPSTTFLVDRIFKFPPTGPPGQKWSYASEGYVLLAAILEKATGRTYNDYVREKLFKPAGMSTAWFVGEHDPCGTAPSHAYVGWNDNGSPADWPVNARYAGAGSIVANAQDLYRWASALWGGNLLSAESKKAMFTKHASPGGDDEFGYGIFRWKTKNGAIIEEHGGDTAIGFNGLVRWYPEKRIALIITCNASQDGGTSYRAAIQGAITDRLEAGKPPKVDGATWIKPERATALAGSYGSSLSQLEVVFDGSNAWMGVEDQQLLNAIRRVKPEQAVALAAANAKTSTLLEGMKNRNLAALDSALGADRSARDELLDEWNRTTVAKGAVIGFHILGGVLQRNTARTFARLRFVGGKATIACRWAMNGAGPLVAWNLSASTYPIILPLAQKGGSLFAHELISGDAVDKIVISHSGITMEFPNRRENIGRRRLAGWKPE